MVLPVVLFRRKRRHVRTAEKMRLVGRLYETADHFKIVVLPSRKEPNKVTKVPFARPANVENDRLVVDLGHPIEHYGGGQAHSASSLRKALSPAIIPAISKMHPPQGKRADCDEVARDPR